MREYYSNGNATIYQSDCVEALVELPDSGVDAVIMDPPYCAGAVGEAQRVRAKGQGLRSENLRRFGWFTGDNMGTSGLIYLLRSVATETRRLVKPTGSLQVFCDWRMVSSIQPAIESAGLRFQNMIFWDKGSMGLGTGFRPQHEIILHYTYGSPEYHDRSISNVIRSKRVNASVRQHQTEKPIDLLTPLIRVSTPANGLVLDPFMGSGSTAVASLLAGRRFIGCEISQDYCEIAKRRIEAECVSNVRTTMT